MRPSFSSSARALVLSAATAAACGGSSSDAAGPPADGPPGPNETSADAAAPPADAGGRDASRDAARADADAADAAPTWTDGVKDALETDVDCGGADMGAPRCGVGKSCVVAGDCAARHCEGGACAQLAPSCTGAAGTVTCGQNADEDCCTTLPVPGGSYLRYDDPNAPATVSAFKLDKFEITVGRLRAFFQAKGGNPRGSPPTPGAGAHPKVPGSGWRSTFDERLPGSWLEINERLGAVGCVRGGDNSDGGAATWTPTPGPYEELPITCIDWYTLFAFCAWDGGRLPTDAEWGFAAQGGDEQRQFAWSQPGGPQYSYLVWGVHDALVAGGLYDTQDQVWKFSVGTPFRTTDPVTGKVNDGPAHMTPPGRKLGYGKWGHADLTGNVLEFLLDAMPIPKEPCTDCANVAWPDPPQDQVGWYPGSWWNGDVANPVYYDGKRSLRGGSWDPTHVPFAWFAYEYYVLRTYYAAGGRCARD